MKNNSNYKLFVFIGLIFMLAMPGCNQKHNKIPQKEEFYTCPMHPSIVEKEPGKCPICGMDLVKKSGHEPTLEVTEGINHLLNPTNTAAVSSIKTVTPLAQSLTTEIKASGFIAYDTRQSFSIPIRYSGRIEKLFVQYNYQSVKKGQKILEIYSPEIVAVQRELLFLLKEDTQNTQIIEAAKQKLRLFGVTETQIRQLIQTGKENYALPVYSPYNGYIIETSENNSSLPQKTSSMATNPTEMGMGGTTDNVASGINNPTALNLREGMYLKAGQRLFNIINTENIWAEFDIKQNDARYIKKGDDITITSNDREAGNIKTQVSFIQPFFKQGEGFIKIRVYLKNSQTHFKAGALVEAHFSKTIKDAQWIPASAVVDLGNKKVTFLKKENIFYPHPITTGLKAKDLIQVTSGLEDSSLVAVDGQFMVDSESFIKTKQ